MSKSKKILILILIAFIGIDVLLIYARADKSVDGIDSSAATTDAWDENSSNFVCEKDEEYDGLAIIEYRGSSSRVIIPESIEGQPIVGISSEAFKRRGIKEVKLPMCLKYVGTEAFAENPLHEIILPEGIEFISGGAFSYTELQEIVLPKSLTLLGSEAFKDCYALSKVTVESENLHAGSFVFFANCSLKSLPECKHKVDWRKSDFEYTLIPPEEYEKVCD